MPRALRDYEKQYAPIEKETLSIVFIVERFHKYLYGHKFTIINVHQPLKSIFSRSIVTCPPSIQNFFLWLRKHDFELEYAPSKTKLVFNAKSWSYLNDIKPEFDENTLILHLHVILSNLTITQSRLDQFCIETQKDQILQTLICYTINGWREKHQVPKELFPYYSHCSEIMYLEGILLKNQRIIVPTTLCCESIILQGHFGLENLKKCTRQALFWPLINSEIEDIIKNCPTCVAFHNWQCSEPAIKHPVPQEPWTKVTADLFRLYGHYYF